MRSRGVHARFFRERLAGPERELQAVPQLEEHDGAELLQRADIAMYQAKEARTGWHLYDAEPNTPRADAGNGLWLRGDGQGHFTPVPPSESGFLAPLNVAGLALLNPPAGKVIVVARLTPMPYAVFRSLKSRSPRLAKNVSRSSRTAAR